MAKHPAPARLDRATVIEEACAFVDREGLDRLTLAALANQLGRHASSLYNHVDGLDGLKRDVTIRSMEDLGERLQRAVLGRGGVEGLRAVAVAYRDFAVERPGRFAAATTWHVRLERTDQMLQAVAPSRDALHAVMASFGLGPIEVRHASRVYSSTLVGYVQTAGRAFTAPPALDETFDRLVELFASALAQGGWLGAR